MLYSEIMAVCSEIHTKHINTLCGQNVEFVNVKRGGTYSNHWAFEALSNFQKEKLLPIPSLPVLLICNLDCAGSVCNVLLSSA
jgi:hypothetical protein